MSIENHPEDMNDASTTTNASIIPEATPETTDHSNENPLLAPDTAGQTSTDATVSALKNGFIGHLELLEERPVINKERLDVGKVTVSKHTRTKTITVPIELVEEYVTIQTEYNDGDSQALLTGDYDDKDIVRHIEPSLDSRAVVTINGNQVDIGDEPVEIILSRQVANITKDTYAVQEVAVSKTTHTHTDSIQVELQHEELDVQEEGFLDHSHSRISEK